MIATSTPQWVVSQCPCCKYREYRPVQHQGELCDGCLHDAQTEMAKVFDEWDEADNADAKAEAHL